MSFIGTDKRGPVTWITINRPQSHNALLPSMHDELEAAFNDFAADDAQRICVITGAGEKAFCAGSDLKAGIGKDYPAHGYAGLIERFDLEKPVIACVNGYALGGGFEIALACDIIIASETASFGLPEPLAGVVALGGGLHRLPRQIGLKNAMGMILTSQPVSAQEGYRLGFVNAVCTPEALMETVDQWCQTILKGAPLALQASKATVMQGLREDSLETALKAQKHYPEFARWHESEDIDVGINAFTEKRKPKWTNR